MCAHRGLTKDSRACGPYNEGGEAVKVKTPQRQINRTIGVLVHQILSKWNSSHFPPNKDQFTGTTAQRANWLEQGEDEQSRDAG